MGASAFAFVGAPVGAPKAVVDISTMQRIDKTPKPAGEESLFAELDVNDVVVRVLVISAENVATGKWGDPNNFVRTSNKNSIRKNYAGVGYKYDRARDAFIAPQPVNAVGFDETKARWIMPDPLPENMIQ